MSPRSDGQSTVEELPTALRVARQVASDRSRSLSDRLEAYEDIVASEVGETVLVRARNVERQVGLRRLFLKFEGGNPSGTQKDRIAFAQVTDALRRGYEVITVATCGNFGAAVAFAARLAGLRCEVVIPERSHTRRIAEIGALDATVLRVPGAYEDAVAHSRSRARELGLYDANPGGSNERIQTVAYARIAHEIYTELRGAPAAVAVPVSNGTTLAGIHQGFVALHRRGKTSRVPQMVAGSAVCQNPVVHAWERGAATCEDLPPESIHETAVNEALVNWHSIDGDRALAAVRRSGGWVEPADDQRLRDHATLIRELQGLDVLPASTAGLVALLDVHARRSLPEERYVAVLTARNV